MNTESYFEVENIARVWILVGKPLGLLLAFTSVQTAHCTALSHSQEVRAFCETETNPETEGL